jgi:hypothetical protein
MQRQEAINAGELVANLLHGVYAPAVEGLARAIADVDLEPTPDALERVAAARRRVRWAEEKWTPLEAALIHASGSL